MEFNRHVLKDSAVKDWIREEEEEQFFGDLNNDMDVALCHKYPNSIDWEMAIKLGVIITPTMLQHFID